LTKYHVLGAAERVLISKVSTARIAMGTVIWKSEGGAKMGPEDQHEQPAEKDGYEKWLDEIEAKKVMHVCLKCGAESWQVPSSKLKRCVCDGQIIPNPRRG
jgi:hypothetical protein